MRDLNLDHLRAFADVVTLGSFSAAAARLHLTQPAVSLQIRGLERRLGVRLIERVGKRARPTPAGLDLMHRLGPIHAAVEAAIEAVAPHRDGAVGRVRLGTGATACIYLLPRVLRRLRLRLPGLELVVRTGNTPEILAALEANEIDAALVTLPAPGRAFDVTPILDDEQVAIFPSDRVPPSGGIAPADLAGLPLILYETGGHGRRVVEDWFLAGGIAARPAMELGSVEAIKELVAAGLGAAIVPRLAVTGGGARSDIRVRSLTPRLDRTLALVLRRDKVPDRGLRSLIDELRTVAPRAGEATIGHSRERTLRRASRSRRRSSP